MAKVEMPTVEMHVRADGLFGVVIDGKMHNGRLDRDGREVGPEPSVEWISPPKDKHTRQAFEQAAEWLVGLLPRVNR